jgi:hypothetical protein
MGTSAEFEFEVTDPVAMRKEELKPLELHPREYMIYAYNAITAVAEILLDRQAEKEVQDRDE